MIFARTLMLAAFVALISLFVYGDWFWIAVSLIYYKIIVGLLGNQIAQHRYFSHQSFETGTWRKYFLYFVSLTTGVNPRDYALIHRHHHVWSDGPNDIHSVHNHWQDIFFPLTGRTSNQHPIKVFRVLDNDLKKFYSWHAYIITAVLLITAAISWQVAVFVLLSGVAWNYIHMILFRVLLVHVQLPGSYQSFDTKDSSWNNKFLQILDIGEGLHNNHHRYPNRYNQAVFSNEFDPAGWVVKYCFAVGHQHK
jgi:stearoyl-CoA desaturase (delta-9 desaturase)